MCRIRTLFVAVSAAVLTHASITFAADGASPGSDTIAINDNRTPAGSLEGTTLTVHLEAREGTWYPDGDADPGINVRAFGMEGGPLQIPGPLIRVVEKSRWATERLTTSNFRRARLAIFGLISPTQSAIC
jgi:hypothetical protein